MKEIYQSLVAVEPATLIVTIINLFLQMWIVKKFFLNKVLDILDKRRKAADEEIEQAEAAKGEALAMKETYEENMKQAKAEANEILTHIELEKKNALNGAKDEISGIAMAIAEKVVERQLNEEDQEKLVNQFIEDLGGAL